MGEEVKESVGDLVLPHLDAFMDSMRAVGEVAEFVNENAKSLTSIENEFVLQAKRLFPGIDDEVHREAAKYLHPKVHERMEGLEKLEKEGASLEEVAALEKSWAAQVTDKFLELTGEPGYFYRYGRVWERTGKASAKSRLLRNSLLMGAVSDFEVLVSGLVRSLLTLKPEIIRSGEQKYTFKDLEPFSTLDEFRHHCAENMADNLLRGGFDDWMAWFSKKHRLDVPGVTDDADALVEIFQRRHLLVHNGGKVNRFYLAKVSDTSAEEGDPLYAGPRYLRRALNELTVAGVKLATTLWEKLSSDADEMERIDHYLDHVAFEYLTAESWSVAYRLSDWRFKFDLRPGAVLIAQVNRWVAKKHIDGVEPVHAEVREWDTSTLAGVYRLAKLGLLDENEEAYELAKALIASGELDRDDWRHWPVLEGVRRFEVDNVAEVDRLWVGSFDEPHVEGPDQALA